MQIIIANNYGKPGIGYTTSRLFLKSTKFRFVWRSINGFRVSTMTTTYFVELWSRSYPNRKMVVDHRNSKRVR